MLSDEVKSFLKAVGTIEFRDGSSVEGYRTRASKLRFRGIRADGHTQTDFETVLEALAWAWELQDN